MKYVDETLLASQAKALNSFFRAHGIDAYVSSIRVLQGFISFELYTGSKVSLADLRSKSPDIGRALGILNTRVSNSGQGISVQIDRKGEVEPVFIQDLFNLVKSQGHLLSKSTALLGTDEQGRTAGLDFASPSSPHLLISGSTGSGKTELMKALVSSLVLNNKPHTLQIGLIDPKRREVTPFLRGITPHLMAPIAQEVDKQVELLESAVRIMEDRVMGNPHPRIFIIVDELADLCLSGGAKVVDMLTRIAQRGREPGVHLIACTQKPAASHIGPLLKANLPARLTGRVFNAEDSKVATGLPQMGAEKLTRAGSFILVAGGSCVRIQGAMMGPTLFANLPYKELGKPNQQGVVAVNLPSEELPLVQRVVEAIRSIEDSGQTPSKTSVTRRLFGTEGGDNWKKVSSVWDEAKSLT